MTNFIEKLKKYKILVIFCSILCLIILSYCSFMFGDYDVLITDKIVKRINNVDTYLINVDKLDDNKDTIEVVILRDIKWLLSWNTSDDFANITIGKEYHIKTYGFRLAFLSKFPIIYRYKLIN